MGCFVISEFLVILCILKGGMGASQILATNVKQGGGSNAGCPAWGNASSVSGLFSLSFC